MGHKNMRNQGTTKTVTLALMLGSVAGCINLDRAPQVKDLRILAMRVDPPEILFSFFHIFPYEQRGGFPLGPYNITAQVLAVDPQGREVQMSVRLCPEQVDGTSVNYEPGCEGYVIRNTAAPDEARAIIPLVQPDEYRRKADPSLGGEVTLPTVSMTFTDRAMDYMLPHTADGEFDLVNTLLFPSFPSLVVRAQIPGTTESEVAFKRFTVGLDISPDGIPPELGADIVTLFEGITGAAFCPDVDPDADVNCIKRRVPNRNPTIARLLYLRTSQAEQLTGSGVALDEKDPTAGGRFKDITERIEVAPGERIRIRPVHAQGDIQPYQGFGFDLQNSRLLLTNYKEDMAWSWFTTVGSIDASTTTQFTPTADAFYEVSQDAPDGPAHVWVVLRDQRGGVDWRRIDFVVKTPDGGGGGPFGGFGF
jgi:hypothetical protein